MFGPSKEVQKIIDDMTNQVKDTWSNFEQNGSGAFANSEFIDEIMSWREQSHPKKMFGGYKTYEDFYFGIELLEDTKAVKKIAKEIDAPTNINGGEGWKQIDFTKELMLYSQYDGTAIILTNENLYLFFRQNAFGTDSFIKVIPISNLNGTILVIQTGVAHHGVKLNGEKIGYLTLDIDSVHVTRELLNAACNRAPKIENNNNVTNVISEESTLDKIKKLKELYDADAISESEFNEKKNKLMDSL